MPLEAATSPTLLTHLSATVSTMGAIVVAVDLVEVGTNGTRIDVTFDALDADYVADVGTALKIAGYHVRHVSERTFLSHLGGTIEVIPKVPTRTRDDLSLIYTPGVGRIAAAIAQDPDVAWNLTIEGNSVVIATDGSAVLGLGDLLRVRTMGGGSARHRAIL